MTDKFVELLHKYADDADESFFNGNKLNIKKLSMIYEHVNGDNNPNKFIYAMLNGEKSLIMNDFINRKGMTDEQLYRKCIYKGTTWEKLLNYKEPTKNQLL